MAATKRRVPGWVWGLLAGLPAVPAVAQDAGGAAAGRARRAPVEWASTTVARENCLAARPEERVFFDGDEVARGEARKAHEKARSHAFRALHVVKVPARGFSFGEYRTKDGVLPLDLAQPLRTLHGAVSVALRNDGTLGFPLDAAAAQALVAARKAGTATLEVSFELDGTLGSPCSGSLVTNVYAVQALVAMLEVKDGLGKTLAKVEGPAVDRHRDILGGISGTPAASFGTVTSATQVDVVEFGRRFVIGQPKLKDCYEKRIAEDPTLRGTIVFLADVGTDGKISLLVKTADDVQDEPLVACAEEAVRMPTFIGIDGLPAQVQVPVEFKVVPKKR